MKQMIYVNRKKLSFSLLLLSMLTVFTFIHADAASTASLSKKSMTIGVGTYGESGGYYNKTKTNYTLTVKKAVKGASYTFTSSNPKVVSVKVKGSKASLTGVKAGSATITLKQKLKGKTTTVGKCKVTVKKPSVKGTYIAEESLAVGSARIGGAEQEPLCYINYRNPAAKYTFTADSKDLVIKDEKIDCIGYVGPGFFTYAQTYTAKKAGTYTVTVNETVNKKTKKIGTFKVIINDTKLRSEVEIETEDYMYIGNLIEFTKSDMNYYFEGDGFDAETKTDSSIIFIDEEGYVYGINAGTAVLNVYEGKTETDRKLIGTCTVKVVKGEYESEESEDSEESYED